MADLTVSKSAVRDRNTGSIAGGVRRNVGLEARRRLSLYGLASLFAVVALLACAGQVLADSATISVTNTAGESDPAAGLPRVFTVSGSTTEPESIFIKWRGTGGEPCAPTAHLDSGEWFDGYDGEFGDNSTLEHPVNGSFSLQDALTWNQPGTYVFCIWMAKGEGENEITTPITQTITFRSPRGTISATVNPVSPAVSQAATVTVTGSSEAPESVYAKIRPAGGAPCAPTYAADSGENLIEGRSVNGSFSTQASTSQSKAGQYLICLWLAGSDSETPVIAGPQPETFTVGSPHPSSPRTQSSALRTAASLASVESEIRAAHCTLGNVGSAPSATVRSGEVIGLSPAPGTKLSSGAPVSITVSSGTPCVVPRVGRDVSLRRMERRILAAHCSVGEIRYERSIHHRRGTVVGLRPRPRTILPQRAAVQVLVSSGRPRR
jgi:hypothetical protein